METVNTKRRKHVNICKLLHFPIILNCSRFSLLGVHCKRRTQPGQLLRCSTVFLLKAFPISPFLLCWRLSCSLSMGEFNVKGEVLPRLMLIG
ncbi:Hypothetical predicted protein [Podarcis lilfordi]|uniref:Uncharacterized protein n=1 Tax=Podarcis lilfordi TaxID=74358 RepID=A0AA35KMN8_9SAUR|nr:Hypothetical predicted protein [Podarcis lilfordi]